MAKFIHLIKNIITDTDYLLLFLCLITSAFGVTMVTSATRMDADGSLFSRDAKTMLIAVSVGVFIACVVSLIDYNFITKMYPVIGAVCVLLLLLTLVIGVGPSERQDAKTWIRIPLGSQVFFFQSSELMKIGFIITFGMHLELVSDRITKFKTVLLLCIHGAVPVALVAVSGDMGSSLIFLFIFAVMMFCAGVQLRYFAIGATVLCASAPAVWYFVFDNTQRSRILGLIYPDRYSDIMYQQNHGMEALTSGSLTGKGLFQGTLTSSEYVPESENDMIFTTIGEELGFLGCTLALVLIFFIVVRMVVIGKKSPYGATSLMCYGMAAMIASQTIINVGMCLKLLPVIGITLPFFSAGGSSSLCLYIGIGLVLSIYRFDKEKKATNFRIGNLTPFSPN